MNSRRFFSFCLLIMLLLASTGCWDQSEVEELAIVRAMGVDYLPGRKAPYMVTLAINNPAALGGEGGGGGGAGAKPVLLYTGMGATIDLAVQQARFSLSRRVFLSHTELMLVGEEAAKHGLFHIIDLVIRHPELRLSNYLLLTTGFAQQVLSTPERLESAVTNELFGLIRQAEETSEADPQEVFRMLRQITTPGQETHTAVIKVQPLLESVIPELQPDQGGGQGGGQQGGGGSKGGGSDGGGGGGGGRQQQEKILALEGMAVFRGDKLAGYLNHIEARGVLWLTGGTTRGNIVVRDPVHPEHTVSLFVSRSSTKITPVIENGTISFRVEVEEEGDISSQTSQADLSTPEMIEKLNSAKAGAIKQEIEKALKRLQELESDVVGFGTLFNRKNHKEFKKYADRWPEIFRELKVDIRVKAHIRRTGQHSRPARINR